MDIKKVREQYELTQQDIARAAGVSRAYVSELENGNARVINMITPQTHTAIENAVAKLAIIKYWRLLPSSKKTQETKDAYDRLKAMRKEYGDAGVADETVFIFKYSDPIATPLVVDGLWFLHLCPTEPVGTGILLRRDFDFEV